MTNLTRCVVPPSELEEVCGIGGIPFFDPVGWRYYSLDPDGSPDSGHRERHESSTMYRRRWSYGSWSSSSASARRRVRATPGARWQAIGEGAPATR